MNVLPMQLTDTRVRHLYWCVQSPDLAYLSSIPALKVELGEHLISWFIGLDQAPDKLHDYLACRDHKLLGSYFECLWQFFLQFAPGWQLSAHNIQVIEHKQTLGELDILARHPNQAGYHLELAVKFYLQHPDHDGHLSRHWLGPQSRDRLDIKLNKLQNKQFPFLNHQAVKDCLQDLSLDPPTAQALVLKGYLFHRWRQAFVLPKEANTKCQMGQWLHQGEIRQLAQGHEHWVITEKPHWLGNLIFANDPQLQPLSAAHVIGHVQNHFSDSQHKHALMLIRIEKTGDYFTERERFLVVNDAWPHI